MRDVYEGSFYYEDVLFTFTREIVFAVDVRDENKKVASISSVIKSYDDKAGDLFSRKAGYVETVYSPDNTIKRGVRVEVVRVFINGAPAYVGEDIIDTLFLNGVDWETRLMKMRRNLAGKDKGYGTGVSIGESMESAGYSFVQLPTAGRDEMDISAWNHSGSARVAANAKARKVKRVDLSILGL